MRKKRDEFAIELVGLLMRTRERNVGEIEERCGYYSAETETSRNPFLFRPFDTAFMFSISIYTLQSKEFMNSLIETLPLWGGSDQFYVINHYVKVKSVFD